MHQIYKPYEIKFKGKIKAALKIFKAAFILPLTEKIIFFFL